MDQFMKDVADVMAPKEEAEEGALHPYEQLEKAKVLQDARIFHDSILVRENPRKCCRILAQILYLQNDPKSPSSKLTRTEATELFFASTKLFVDVEDASLRRLVYLFIKEIQPLCDPSDVIIVTSCLIKDMTCDVNLYRANAIRVLVNIIDSAMLGSIERYIKQAILDNDEHVSNAALVSAAHLFDQSSYGPLDNANIVKRWVSEIQEMLVKQSSSGVSQRKMARTGHKYDDMVQANAMRLLCQMKSRDRLGMAKILQKFGQQAGSGIQSPLAIVILIRLSGKLLLDELGIIGHSNSGDIRDINSLCKLCFDFLETSLSHSDSMISYESARIICSLPTLGLHNLTLAMKSLRNMLLSDKPAVRLAAVQTLSQVTNQRAVVLCVEAVEDCIEDNNKQIATLAVRVLLKAGSEGTVDKILSTLPSLLESVDDEYKITISNSLEELCLKYPSKHRAIVGFFSNLLRDEGGFEFKQSIVTSIVSLMKQMPETTESSLLHLCDFIDDCEYTILSTQCIHIIADVGPLTPVPSQYIRFIYNRVILDNATIRAAAVSALAKFAAHCPSLRTSIMTLLKHCLCDDDDETRDRASIAVSVLSNAMMSNPYVAPDIDDYDNIVHDSPADGDVAAMLYLQQLPMSFKNLEHSIKAYVSSPGATESSEQLTFSTLPVIEDKVEVVASATTQTWQKETEAKQGMQPPTIHNEPSAAVYAIPELAEFGRVFRSSAVISLTEDETEYVVRCIKHIMPEHIILQFLIQNTVEDQRLDNCIVAIDMQSSTKLYQIIGDLSADRVEYGRTANAFTVIQRNKSEPLETITFACQLNFTLVQVDTETHEILSDGYQEEFPLDNLELATSDFMAKVVVPDFRKAWNSINDSEEALGKFSLPRTIDQAISAVLDLLGMAACDGTGRLNSKEAKQHMLHMSGRFLGGHDVLARAQLTVSGRPTEGTMLKIAVRCDDKAVSDIVMNCIK